MTTREVIAHAQFTLETLEAKSEAEGRCVECDRKHKEFLRAVIECAKKAMVVDKAKELAEGIRKDELLRERGGNE